LKAALNRRDETIDSLQQTLKCMENDAQAFNSIGNSEVNNLRQRAEAAERALADYEAAIQELREELDAAEQNNQSSATANAALRYFHSYLKKK
jgi:predicted nucleotidyltransferase